MSLSLQVACAHVEGEHRPYRRDEGLLVYQRDLAAPFGVEVEERLLAEGTNVTFTELAERLLSAIPAPAAAADMTIVSYGLPDWYPFKTVAAHVDHLLGGGSFCFAVSEQGLCSPFTALRIAGAFARSGRCQTLALFVLEQSTFPYWEPLAHDMSLADSGALLLFGSGGSYELGGVWAGPPAVPLGHVLDQATRTVPASSTLLVAGPWTDPTVIGVRPQPCHQVGVGSYCTSVWLDLARHHESWAGTYDAVVLCETDPRSGRSQAALLRRTTGARHLISRPTRATTQDTYDLRETP